MQKNTYFKNEIYKNNPEIAIIILNNNVLGGHEAIAFTEVLENLVSKNIKYVIIDLKDVILMNSSGLGMLVGGMTTLKKYEIQMVLANVPEKVKKILSMTHLDNIFKIYNDVLDAVRGY